MSLCVCGQCLPPRLECVGSHCYREVLSFPHHFVTLLRTIAADTYLGVTWAPAFCLLGSDWSATQLSGLCLMQLADAMRQESLCGVAEGLFVALFLKLHFKKLALFAVDHCSASGWAPSYVSIHPRQEQPEEDGERLELWILLRR